MCDRSFINDVASEAVRASANSALGSSGEWKQRLAEFDGLAVGDEAFHDFAGRIGFDFVHQLHGFDDADHLALFHAIAGRDKGEAPGEGEP